MSEHITAPNYPRNARVIKVIETELEERGKGVTGSPLRRVRQYWSLDGFLLAEADPSSNLRYDYKTDTYTTDPLPRP